MDTFADWRHRPARICGQSCARSASFELTADAWLRTPQHERAASQLAELDRALDVAVPSRDVPGLLLLDPERPVRYYAALGRAHAQSGRLVARRGQAYGADLWCYVQLRAGHPERLIDLPIPGSRWRGCDEAWHLQLAIDAQKGEPQRFGFARAPQARTCRVFSPVPMWARRRWDAVGEPVLGSGCLFAHRLAETELAEELRFAHEALWLQELSGSARRP